MIETFAFSTFSLSKIMQMKIKKANGPYLLWDSIGVPGDLLEAYMSIVTCEATKPNLRESGEGLGMYTLSPTGQVKGA